MRPMLPVASGQVPKRQGELEKLPLVQVTTPFVPRQLAPLMSVSGLHAQSVTV